MVKEVKVTEPVKKLPSRTDMVLDKIRQKMKERGVRGILNLNRVFASWDLNRD